MSRIMRSIKNATKCYSSAQVKVREATCNDPGFPTVAAMKEIAALTDMFCDEIMQILKKRLEDKGKNLAILDYCHIEGSPAVITGALREIHIISRLRRFKCTDDYSFTSRQSSRIRNIWARLRHCHMLPQMDIKKC